MRKLTPTLTQSGLLAVLLQRQRYKIGQLAWHRAQRKHMRAALWSTLTWPFRALTGRTLVDYTGRRQQIHGDLRIEHPEWIESNGESPVCDSYEARLTEMLNPLKRTGSNGSIIPLHRVLEPAVTGS